MPDDIEVTLTKVINATFRSPLIFVNKMDEYGKYRYSLEIRGQNGNIVAVTLDNDEWNNLKQSMREAEVE